MTETPHPEPITREAMERDIRSGGAVPSAQPMPTDGWDPSFKHPDLVERIRATLDEEGAAAEASRLEALNVHESDVDPAPDLQPEPEHWLAQELREALQERKETGNGMAELVTVRPEDAFALGYETAIHDLIARSSSPTVESGVMLPDGERVPMGEERRDAAADQA